MKNKLKINVILIVLLVSLLISSYSIHRGMSPYLLSVAKQQVQMRVNEMLMETLNELDIPSDLMKDHKLAAKQLNELLKQAIELAQQRIVEPLLNESIASIPIGYFSGLAYFSKSGPTLSVRYTMFQSVQAESVIETESLGINNTLIKISFKFTFKGDVHIGFSQSYCEVISSIPILLEYIEGKVPTLYPYGLESQ